MKWNITPKQRWQRSKTQHSIIFLTLLLYVKVPFTGNFNKGKYKFKKQPVNFNIFKNTFLHRTPPVILLKLSDVYHKSESILKTMITNPY